MPRKLRIEYPGAAYHIINRGNYRFDIFEDDRTKEAFEACLFEACEKSSWILDGFVLMRNHFHLDLETPEGNLVTGMHWLECTFANRFNRFRKENGHLFQGRYKSIPVEEGKPLGEVCDYIHLNPVRAGIVDVPHLQEYRFSSYWYLHHPLKRPKFMRPQAALEHASGIPDNPQGWAIYADRLALQAEKLARMPGERKCQQRRFSRRWMVGSDEFRRALIEEHGLATSSRAWTPSGAAELRALKWAAILRRGLLLLGRTQADVRAARKSAPWKLALAVWMKTRTQVSNPWLSKNLHLGVPSAISRNAAHYRLHLQAPDPLWKLLTAKPLNE